MQRRVKVDGGKCADDRVLDFRVDIDHLGWATYKSQAIEIGQGQEFMDSEGRVEWLQCDIPLGSPPAA